ncbi:MAG TPA: potassium channel family protein [bacterium]|nr:potassium channel family protein [bacterium]
MNPTIAKIWDRLFRYRFVFLFLTLLVPYVLHPMMQTEFQSILSLDITFSLVLFMGVFALSDRHHLALTALAMVLLSQLLTWSSRAISGHWLIVTGMILTMVYLIYTVSILFRHVVKSRAPTFHTIFASLCIYLLTAYIWAFAYSLLEDTVPGSFHFNPDLFALVPKGKHIYSHLYYFFYFSLTTQTTLGFGDILPASPWSRMMTSMEAVLGQLYLVVMVTYLIGLHITEKARASK